MDANGPFRDAGVEVLADVAVTDVQGVRRQDHYGNKAQNSSRTPVARRQFVCVGYMSSQAGRSV